MTTSTTARPISATRTPIPSAGRIGARLARDWDVGGEGSTRKLTVWGRADVWHEFLSDPTTEFSSATGFIPFTADPERELGQARDRRRYAGCCSHHLYGNVNYDVSFDGEADAWEGKFGIKMTW